MNIATNTVHPFDPTTNWPDPDMCVIKPERSPAPVMTDEDFATTFGDWAGWLKSAAEVKSAHVDYVALALLSAASAAIGNTRWAVPWDGWKEPPILWGMLVGDPSAGKSPALDAVLDPIKEIDAELSRDFQKERTEWSDKDEVAKLVLSQWKSDMKSALADDGVPPEKPDTANAGGQPVRNRIRITDVTTEKVAELVQATWRGLLLSRDELSGWLGSMDRYSGGGDRPFWLEAFGGRSYTIDRKNSPDPIIIEHLSVAVLGGTQPDKLDTLLVHSGDDGLLARFLTVFPDPVDLKRPTVTLDTATPERAFKRLHGLSGTSDEHGCKRPFFLHLNEDAQTGLQTFRVQCREWEGQSTGLMKSHIGKLPGLAVRVSMVLALLDWAIDDNAETVSCITAEHLGRACHYVGEHLRGHAHRAYGVASVSREISNARTVANIICDEGLSILNVRNIQHRGRPGLGKSADIKAAFSVLIDAGWLMQVSTGTGGRPSQHYAVNPKVRAVK